MVPGRRCHRLSEWHLLVSVKGRKWRLEWLRLGKIAKPYRVTIRLDWYVPVRNKCQTLFVAVGRELTIHKNTRGKNLYGPVYEHRPTGCLVKMLEKPPQRVRKNFNTLFFFEGLLGQFHDVNDAEYALVILSFCALKKEPESDSRSCNTLSVTHWARHVSYTVKKAVARRVFCLLGRDALMCIQMAALDLALRMPNRKRLA